MAAARHLSELVKRGKIAHVGATNFDVPRLKQMVEEGEGVKIVSNQVRLVAAPAAAAARCCCCRHGTVARVWRGPTAVS